MRIVRAIMAFRVMQLNLGKALTVRGECRCSSSSHGMLPFLRPSARRRHAADASSVRAQPRRSSTSATARYTVLSLLQAKSGGCMMCGGGRGR
jgi:hypothetical protein